MFKKVLSLIVVVYCFCGLLAVPASANNYYITGPYGYYQANIPIASYYLPSGYNALYLSAMSSWGNAGMKKWSFTNLTGPVVSGNFIRVKTDGGNWAGRYLVYAANGNTKNKTTRFEIEINTTHCTTDPIRKSVIAHELGHAMGLADYTLITTVLMNHDRNRSTLTTPTPSDVNGANSTR